MGQLTFLIPESNTNKEDVTKVMKELSTTCHACRLSLIHPDNRGIIWRGDVNAKVAIIGEAPGDMETEIGRPLVGPSGKEWERWARLIGLDTIKGCFISNVVQCQPEKHRIDGRLSQQAPDKDEIKACFGSRTLRVLKAMPNLEVVITLGWVAAKTILGGEPKSKTHEGQWFESSLLPGIAVFCLVHPAYLLREPSAEKTGKVETCLQLFKREYLETKKVIGLAKATKEAREKEL
jgi:uracil-DNA glycosylase family 4